jgi:NADP-dependent 3-hydroxy acid dehydrogenase YdfG
MAATGDSSDNPTLRFDPPPHDGQPAAARHGTARHGTEQEYGPPRTPNDVARTIRCVLEQPPHVHLDTVRIRPTRQKL